jgi:hypothetical protein
VETEKLKAVILPPRPRLNFDMDLYLSRERGVNEQVYPVRCLCYYALLAHSRYSFGAFLYGESNLRSFPGQYHPALLQIFTSLPKHANPINTAEICYRSLIHKVTVAAEHIMNRIINCGFSLFSVCNTDLPDSSWLFCRQETGDLLWQAGRWG